MEILVRTIAARRPDGIAIGIREYWKMIDHSPLQNGTDWLPAGRRFALETSERVRRLDEFTFQVETSAEVLTICDDVVVGLASEG